VSPVLPVSSCWVLIRVVYSTVRLSWLLASFFSAEIIGPAASSSLQVWNPWAPAVTGLSALGTAMLLVHAFPESLHKMHPETMSQDHDSHDGMNLPLDRHRRPTKWLALAPGLTVFFVSPLRNVVMEIMIQYASKRFDLSLGNVRAVFQYGRYHDLASNHASGCIPHVSSGPLLHSFLCRSTSASPRVHGESRQN
jgi:hypothetical protein